MNIFSQTQSFTYKTTKQQSIFIPNQWTVTSTYFRTTVTLDTVKIFYTSQHYASSEYTRIQTHLKYEQLNYHSTSSTEDTIRPLSQHLINRGYNQTDILNAIQNARERNRNDLLKYKHKPETSVKRIPFVLTYHPNTPNIKMILNTHWPTIQSLAQLKDIFSEKLVIAYKRRKSLRDILVRVKLKPKFNNTPLGQCDPVEHIGAKHVTLCLLHNHLLRHQLAQLLISKSTPTVKRAIQFT